MARFEIVFQGQVQSGVPVEEARARIGQLFQVAGEQLDTLFSGRRIVIKQGLDEAAAAKYRAAIERAGFCEYFDPVTGEGCGGEGFSWTAAAYLHFTAMSART